MKKIIILFILLIPNILRIYAQESGNHTVYKVPDGYHFDYKVVYELGDAKKNTETIIYYFDKNGDHISMESGKNSKDHEKNLMVNTSDGMMITFGEEPFPKNSGKTRKVLKVIDVKSMYQDAGKTVTAVAKSISGKDTTSKVKVNPGALPVIKKTGRTKPVFGYTAEEYSFVYNNLKNGTGHSVNMSFWYAKVDFNPEIMFSMGMGSLVGGMTKAAMNQSSSGTMPGFGNSQKDFLLTEMNYSDTGGKSSSMKVVDIEKINFDKSTEGYYIKNYSGMTMEEMVKKEMEEK